MPNDSEGGGLARRLLTGSMYLAATSWITSAFGLVANIAMARMLGPENLGFYAIVFSVHSMIGMIGAFSIALAVIQAPDESDSLYDTAFAISLLLAGIAFAVALALAPLLAAVQSTSAAWFLVALGASQFFTLTSQVFVARLERQLRFRDIALIHIIGANIPLLLALALARAGAGASSLLVREVFMAILICALSVAMSRYRFRHSVNRSTAASLMSFARPMFLSRSLEVGLERVDRLIVGSLLGELQLGFYHQARVLAESGLVATRPINRLSFNLYSRLHDRQDRLTDSVRLVGFFLVRVSFAGAATLLLFPNETVRLLLGEQWMGAAPILGWLAIYAGLLPLFENLKILAYGRAEIRPIVMLRVAQLALFSFGAVLAAVQGEVASVAGALTFITIAGWGVAIYINRVVVGDTTRELYAAPAAAIAVSSALIQFGLPHVQGLGLPYWVYPFVPPTLFAATLSCFEPRRLLNRAMELRRVFRGERPNA